MKTKEHKESNGCEKYYCWRYALYKINFWTILKKLLQKNDFRRFPLFEIFAHLHLLLSCHSKKNALSSPLSFNCVSACLNQSAGFAGRWQHAHCSKYLQSYSAIPLKFCLNLDWSDLSPIIFSQRKRRSSWWFGSGSSSLFSSHSPFKRTSAQYKILFS